MTAQEHELLLFLAEYVSEHKKQMIEGVLDERTRHITVVLEDIYQPQNASAVIRSCDCFGIQDLHVIENSNAYEVNPRVVHGASKWVDLISHSEKKDNTASCLRELRSNGYRIVGTSPGAPDQNCTSVQDLDIRQKTAVLFGTEMTGLSELALDQVDELITIPMYGFTESFNISVSAALCMNALVTKLRQSEINWKLSEDERSIIKLNWFRKIVPRADIVEKEFLRKNKL